MRKLWLVLLGISVFLLPACSQTEQAQVWYGISDRYGFMVALDSQGEYFVLAAIERGTLYDYREALAKEGILSNDLGALQSLFGKPGDNYLQGDEEEWLALTKILLAQEGISYQGVRPSIQVLGTMIGRHAGYLRKRPALDTLEKLIGPHTDVEILVKSLTLLEKGVVKVRIYDMNRFLPQGANPKILEQWITDWTENVLREAMHE